MMYLFGKLKKQKSYKYLFGWLKSQQNVDCTYCTTFY